MIAFVIIADAMVDVTGFTSSCATIVVTLELLLECHA
jgi:hypothetical protein